MIDGKWVKGIDGEGMGRNMGWDDEGRLTLLHYPVIHGEHLVLHFRE